MVSPKNIFLNKDLNLDDQQRATVTAIFTAFKDPVTSIDLVSAGCVSGLNIHNGQLNCVIEIPEVLPKASQVIAREDLKTQYERLVANLSQQLKHLDFIDKVVIALTANHSASHHIQPIHKTAEKIQLPQIKKIIAVASGKGGVGKSTLAVNIAVGLQKMGYRVGLMDADFYGPSIPMMLALNQQPQINVDKKFIPLDFHGLKCMSMGFLVNEETPIIWRGPIVQSSFQKLLMQTAWPELDILIIDLPPGTGDIHLTMIQKVSLNGAVIVSTPQDLALLDARRAIAMFKKLGTPIIGIIENMSLFTCPHCHKSIDIFNQHGVKNECSKSNITFLGALPLHIAIRHGGDLGQPIALQQDQALVENMQNIIIKISTKIFDKIV